MHLLNILVILWLVLCLAVSFVLIKTIYDHIRLKAVSSVTIIDLTYSDCLICQKHKNQLTVVVSYVVLGM